MIPEQVSLPVVNESAGQGTQNVSPADPSIDQSGPAPATIGDPTLLDHGENAGDAPESLNQTMTESQTSDDVERPSPPYWRQYTRDGKVVFQRGKK